MTVTFQKGKAGTHRFRSDKNFGCVRKEGGVWCIFAQTNPFAKDFSNRTVEVGYGHTFAEAKQKVESMYN